MLVSVTLHLDALPGKPNALNWGLRSRDTIRVPITLIPGAEHTNKSGRLEAEALNGTDALELFVFAHTSRTRRPARQPRQRRLRRGGPEHRADARP
jgi:N-acetyl-gamma-glutamyl-phosphate reductase